MIPTLVNGHRGSFSRQLTLHLLCNLTLDPTHVRVRSWSAPSLTTRTKEVCQACQLVRRWLGGQLEGYSVSCWRFGRANGNPSKSFNVFLSQGSVLGIWISFVIVRDGLVEQDPGVRAAPTTVLCIGGPPLVTLVSLHVSKVEFVGKLKELVVVVHEHRRRPLRVGGIPFGRLATRHGIYFVLGLLGLSSAPDASHDRWNHFRIDLRGQRYWPPARIQPLQFRALAELVVQGLEPILYNLFLPFLYLVVQSPQPYW